MSKTFSALLLTLALSTAAHAQFIGPGAPSNIASVKSISDMHDVTRVTLIGYLVRETKTGHYLFKDDTGEIEVQIDTATFREIKVTPKTKIKIVGDIDKESKSTLIGVDYLEITK